MSYVLKPMGFKQAEYTRNEFFIAPEAGVPWDAILKPEYWAHVAAKLRPYDEIIVVPEDDSFYGRVIVLRTGTAIAFVRELQFVEFKDRVVEGDLDDQDFDITWSGPIARYRVTRRSDGMVLAEGEEVKTKEMAQDFVRNLRKALAA